MKLVIFHELTALLKFLFVYILVHLLFNFVNDAVVFYTVIGAFGGNCSVQFILLFFFAFFVCCFFFFCFPFWWNRWGANW